MTDNVSDTLNKAADLIEERGWGQGEDSWASCEEGICIDEAIARALGFTGCNTPPSQGGIWPQTLRNTAPALAVASHLALDRKVHDLYVWNDETGRTAAEVIEVLRATALIESARERETAGVTA